ncbi:MAG: 7-cyano-7-deazaguanine synthase QueC [Bdellovibrionaceae bacterium]|nr:7-cyano-7-deazaguanine synthase QueC [Pseudobdellovibrionaceae bacterium]
MGADSYVVLLSAGLDSTVNLYACLQRGRVVLALTANYGQRAALREIQSARRLCELTGVTHAVVDLRFLGEIGQSALTDEQISVPSGTEVSIDDQGVSLQTAKKVWVPNRNGVLLNTAAAYAEALQANFVVPGFNIEEAQTFPDNTSEYMKATTEALRFSTATGVRICCFTDQLNKTEIVQLGIKLGVPFHEIWPCYFGGQQWCGRCESCQRSRRALQAAGLDVRSWFAED